MNSKFMDNAGNFSIITKGAGINLIGTFLRIVLLYSYAIIIARIAGAEAFGLYSLGLATISILAIFSEMGLGKGVIKIVSALNGEKDCTKIQNILQSAIFVGFFTGLLVALLIFLLSKKITTYIFHDLDFVFVLKFFIVGLPLMVVFNIIISFTQGLKSMKYKVLFRDSLQPLIELICSSTLMLFGLNATGLALSHSASYAMVIVFLVFVLNRRVPFIHYKKKSFQYGAYVLKFSSPIMGGDILINILPRITTFLLAFYFSTAMVGVYNIVLRINMIQTIIMMSFNLIFAPFISELYEKNESQELGSILKQVTLWVVTLSIPIIGLCLIFPNFILNLFGNEFKAGANALFILSLGQIINILTGPVMYILIMIGRTKQYFFISLASIFSNIFLGSILIPRLGILGAATSDATITGIFNLIILLIVNRILKIHPYSKKLLVPVLGFIAGGITAILVKTKFAHFLGNQTDVASIMVFLTIYFLVIYKAGILNEWKSAILAFEF